MRSRLTGISLAAVVLTGCGTADTNTESDPKLAMLSVGMTRDSALQVLGPATTSDSFPFVYRREQYLFDGKMTEILFYSPSGGKENQGAAVAESTLRPVIITGGVVQGWGWTHFDSLARVRDLRVRIR